MRVRPTRFGILLTLVIVFLFVARSTAQDSVLAGVALAALVVIALIGAWWPVLAMWAVRVERPQCPVDQRVGELSPLSVALLPGWWLASVVTFELRGPQPIQQVAVATRAVVKDRIAPTQRGEFSTADIALSCVFPFGVMRASRSVVVELDQPVFVGPALSEFRRALPPQQPEFHAEFGAQNDDEMVLRSLRQYEPGDAPRRVHWATTARVGELMVRVDESLANGRTIVIVDLRGAGNAKRIEEIVSEAARIVEDQTNLGDEVYLGTFEHGEPKFGPVRSSRSASRRLACASVGQPGGPSSSEGGGRVVLCS
jgi:uncharacterized protein (DUF58 family)